MRLILPLLLLALPASAQLRSAPAYDGSAPGHPADEPGPELGATAEDAYALLKRGDRDAARLSAARCLRGDAGDERCRIVVEAVEAGIEAPKLSSARADLYRADVHFRAGADWYFHGQNVEARREFDACRRLDPGNPFCALGLRLIAQGERSGERRFLARPRGPETGEWPAALPPDPPMLPLEPEPDRGGMQVYLEGMIHYQKGDYPKARESWTLCARGRGESAADCRAGLARLKQLLGK